MSINTVLAVLSVSDLDASASWYGHLFGRAPDGVPTPEVAEWQIAAQAWVQLIVDPEHAGAAAVTFGVDDLDALVAAMAERNVVVDRIGTPGAALQLAVVKDPDGNRILLAHKHADPPARA